VLSHRYGVPNALVRSGMVSDTAIETRLTLMRKDLILAVQPDLAQAGILRYALLEQVDGEVVIVETMEAALTVIDKRVPKVILLHALTPIREEDYLIAYLRTLVNTNHVQVIGIPHLEAPSDPERPRRSLLGTLKLRKAPTMKVGCDPRLFSADVAGYLAHAREIKERIRYRSRHGQPFRDSDRRGERRWSPREIPSLSSVRFTDLAQVDLINLSSGGALVRTHSRPRLPYLIDDFGARARPSLTFQSSSGAEMRAFGRVIRCQVESPENGRTVYTVAFRFDRSVSL
jgi:hypothetical protein